MDKNKTTKTNKNPSKHEKPKTKFKMPSSLMIIIGVIFGVIVLSWILALTGAHYEVADIPGYTDSAGNPIAPITNQPDQYVEAAGILSFGGAMASGFGNAASLILYLFLLGGFIELMMRTGSMEQGIKSLVKGMNGKEIILIPVLFLIFSLGGTIYGMQEETVGFFILIVPFLILAGFDSMTGLLVVLLGTTTGFAASTVNPFSIGAAIDSLPTDLGAGVDVTVGTALGARFVIWILFTLVGMAFVTGYAYYVQKKPNGSFVASDRDANIEWAQQNFGSVETGDIRRTSTREKVGLSLFALAFVIMVLMYMPWGSFFDGYNQSVVGDDGSGYIYGWNAWLFNGLNKPGYWYFGELITEFTIFTIAIAYTFQMSMKETSDAMWTGAKDILPVAIIIGVARAIPAIMSGSYMDMYIVSALTSGLSGFGSIPFLIIIFVVFLVLAAFIPSTSGLAGMSMPIIGLVTAGTFGVTAGGAPNPDQAVMMVAYMIIMFSIATGILNMFIPTQAIVLASAEASRVPYAKMLKPVLAYAGILVVLTIVVVAPSLGAMASNITTTVVA